MAVKSSPTTALEVVKTDLVFHLLVVALDAPPELRQSNEVFHGRAGSQRREPDLGRLPLIGRPLVQEPLLIAG